MIFAALLILAQDAPAPDVVEGEEIVVQATLGRTTMLFDKGADGRLRNCRIMVSSGSQARDVSACKETPVCYAKTADEVTDCRELTVIEQAELLAAPPPPAIGKGVETFAMPQLTKSIAPAPAGQFGPTLTAREDLEAERQSVKLPPVPKAPGDGPAIKVTLGNPEEAKEGRP